jgi:hypothetical protein
MRNPEKIERMRDIARKHGVFIDRWGNIKYSLENGKEVRFHFKKNIVSLEIKYPNEENARWFKHSRATISKISLDKWETRMERIAKEEKRNQ